MASIMQSTPANRTTMSENVRKGAAKHVLIVEDEADLAASVKFHLEREGYQCQWLDTGDNVLSHVRQHRPDLILLDRMLPGTSGDELAIRLKRDPDTADIPIIVMTAKAEEADELVGFALGADDYVGKPFSMKVLAARAAAVLRRRDAADQDQEVLTVGPLRLDVGRHELHVHGQPAKLTHTEFRLLRALILAKGRVLTRSQLIEAASGTAVVVTDRAVDVHVTALRRKLGRAACWIATVRGVGYTIRESE